MRTLSFVLSGNLVCVTFSAGGIAGSDDEVARRMAAFKPLFTLILNSIIFPDKWTAAPQIPPGSRTTQSLAFDEKTLLIITLGAGLLLFFGLLFRRSISLLVKSPARESSGS